MTLRVIDVMESARSPYNKRTLQMRPDAACISLAEDQVEHVQNCGQSSSPLVRRREPEWYARILNGLLRTADPLRHCGLGNQKGVGDFSRGQTANRP